MKVLIVLVVILSAFIVLRIIQLAIRQLTKKYTLLKSLQNLIPLAGFIIWLILLFWAVSYLFREKSYYYFIIISIIVILGLTLGWFLLKDIIAGIIFKVQNSYSQDEFVQFGEISGRLNKMHLTHISINTQDGKNLKIPYSKVSGEIISQKPETKSYEQNSLRINIPNKLPRKKAEEMMLANLYISPWRISNSSPQVKFLGEDQECYTFEIHVQARNKKHLNHIQDSLITIFL